MPRTPAQSPDRARDRAEHEHAGKCFRRAQPSIPIAFACEDALETFTKQDQRRDTMLNFPQQLDPFAASRHQRDRDVGQAGASYHAGFRPNFKVQSSNFKV